MGKGIYGQKKTIGADEFSALLEEESPKQSTAHKTIDSDEFNSLFDEAPTAPKIAKPSIPSAQDYTNKVFGTDVAGKPIASAVPIIETQPSPQDKIKNATTVIANDYMANNELPASMEFNNPENPVNRVTDPHGDPAYIGTYVQDRIKALDATYNYKKRDLTSKLMEGTPINESELINLKKESESRKQELLNSAGHIVALQLFNKEYGQQKPDKAHVGIALKIKKKQYDTDLSTIDNKIAETYKREHPYGIEASNERDALKRQKHNLDQAFQTEQEQIKSTTKYNPILLGAQYMAAFGDQTAKRDIELIQQGKAISPARKYAYNFRGNDIVQQGTEASINENAIKEGQQHIDINGERLYENNKPFIIEQGKQAIGNKKYSEENPLIHALVPSQLLPDMSKEDIEKYGKEVGLSDKVIKEIQKNPSSVPKSASLLQQFARGVFNTAAPLYEQGVRAAVRLSPNGNMDAVNEHFQPGWETQEGIGAAIAGNAPSEQNSFHNVRGALGQIFEGAGGLATFVGEIGIAGKGLTKLGVEATKADKLANFGIMAFNGYNDAYHTSLEVMGDKPEDEGKRQLYSLINGLASGAIFSINPKATLVKKALGLETKTGAKLIEEIQKSGGVEFLQSKEGKEAVTDYVKAFLKENGTQVGLATATKVSEQIINTIANPERKQDIAEDIKNTAISTSLAMMLPSIGGAFAHTKGVTPLNSAAMFEIGTHPDQYIDHVSQMLAEGKITPQAAQTSHDAILSMKNIIANTPVKNIEGDDLNPNQIKDYAFNMLQEHILNKQLTELKKRAENAKIEPDKAQIAPLTKRIGELQKQRDAILTGKPYQAPKTSETTETSDAIDEEVRSIELQRNPSAEKTGVLDKIEKNAEGYVDEKINQYQKELADELAKPKEEQFDADFLQKRLKEYTDIKARYDKLRVENQEAPEEKAPEEKKSEEKVVESKKEDITLPSTESEQLKSQENGSIQNNEGRKSDSKLSETEGSGQEAQVRQAADSEGRQQQQEAGVLKEPKKEVKGEQEQPVVKQPEPTPEKKGPRQKRKLTPEQPEGQVRELPFTENKKTGDVVVETNKAKIEGHFGDEVHIDDKSVKLPERGLYISDAYLKEGAEKGKGHGQEVYKKALDEYGTIYSHAPVSEDALRVQEKLVEKGIATISEEEIGGQSFRVIKKAKEHATKISEEQQQEVNKQGGEPEHKGTEPPRNEVPQPEADNRDQRISGTEEKEVKAKLSPAQQKIADQEKQKYNVRIKQPAKQGEMIISATNRIRKLEETLKDYDDKGVDKSEKKYQRALDEIAAKKDFIEHTKQYPPKEVRKATFDITNHVQRRENLLAEGEHAETVEEKVMLAMLAMHDHSPEEKWDINSLGNLDVFNAQSKKTEQASVKNYLHEKGKYSIDKWASGLTDDPKLQREYKETAERLIREYPSKVELANAIEAIQKERRALTEGPEMQEYKYEPVAFDDEGNPIFEMVKYKDEITSDELADLYTKGVEGQYFEGYNDEGHPIYKALEPINEAIDKAVVTPEDENAIVEYFYKYLKDNGELDFNKIDVLGDEFKQFKNTLSEDGQKLLDTIAPFDTKEDLNDRIQKIIAKTEEYGKQRKESEAAIQQGANKAIAEGGTGERVPESSGETPKYSPTILGRKQERLAKLQEERISLLEERDEAEGHLNTAFAEANPDPEHIADLEQQYNEKVQALKEKDEQIRKKQREIETQLQYKKGADAIRKFADKNDQDGPLSSPTGLSPHLVAEILRRVADIYESLGNIHVAAIRAAEWAKTQFKGQKGIGALTDAHVRDMFSPYVEPLESEPVIKNAEYLQAAKDWLRDINDGKITREEAIAEVMDNDVSDKTKANILNYIDWHMQGQDYHNSVTLRQPEHEADYYDKYDMLHTGRETSYISEQTLQDITGERVLEIEKAEALAVENITKDAQNIIGLAKNHYGDDLMQWGSGLLRDIKNSTEADPVKKVAAMTGLAWELRAEKHRDPSKTLQVEKLLYQVEKEWKETLRSASKTLNAARANRLFRNEHYADMFAERMMSDQQKKAKFAYENALNDEKRMTEVSQGYEKNGVLREEKEVVKEEKKKSEQKAKEETAKQSKLFEEGKAPKKKGAVEKIRDVFRKAKKDKREARDKEYYAEKLKHTVEEIGGDPKKFMEELKNKIKSIKC